MLLGSLVVSAGKSDLINGVDGFSMNGIAIGDPGTNDNRIAIGDPGVNDNFAKFAIKEQGVKKQKQFLPSNFKINFRTAPLIMPPSIAIGDPGVNGNIAIDEPGVHIAIKEQGVRKALGVNSPNLLLRAVNNPGVKRTSIAIGDPGVNGNRAGIGHVINVKEIAIDESGVHFSEIAIDEPGAHISAKGLSAVNVKKA